MSVKTGPLPALISNPQDDYRANIIACAVLTWLIAAAFVALRFYTRGRLVRVLGREDWVIVGALFFSALNSAGIIEQSAYGFGKHVLDLPPGAFIPMSRAGWYTILWYQVTLFLTKVSILLLYARILTYQHARYGVYAILTIVFLSNIWIFVVVMTACIPLAAWWDYRVAMAGAYCHPRSFWWANVGMHMVTDFLIFALPMPLIFALNASLRQKALLYSIFAFGFLVSLMSVVRLPYLIREYDSIDFTYDNTSLQYWTCIEVNTAIVCACVMTLKPLINRHFPSIVRSRPTNTLPSSDPALDSGGVRPPTIGSRPVRKGPKRKTSWLALPDRTDTGALMVEEDEAELESVMSRKEPEVHLDKKLGLPTQPESVHHIEETRSTTAESMNGPEIRPSSIR